ncbi:acetyl-CoA synthetase [Candidatus Woesearchaeota archaeon]|nr:acetyl-CoA synthetase [Candidatus Woesearchaeota archaeon]
MKKLDFKKTKKLLDKYNIAYPISQIVGSEKNAAELSKKIGFPVVLKISSSSVIHKTEIKGVENNLQDQKQVVAAYEKLSKIISKKKIKDADILMQKMVSGTEIIIGMKRDPQFDVVLLFGLGGVFVEVLEDISFRIAPIDNKQAKEMVQEIKGYKILKGVRGKKPVKISALVNLLTKISKLALENKNIQEIDFNPVIADEKSALVVDMRILEHEK